MTSRNGVYDDPVITDPALRERVANLAQDVTAFRGELHDVRSSMATRADIINLQGAIAALSDRQKPQPAILIALLGLIVSVLGFVGWLAYTPINAATSDLKVAVSSLADKVVLQRQYESDVMLARSDRQSIRNDLSASIGSTIQQQRYNAAARDAEMTILRERFDKVLTRSEFDSQHGDLKNFIASLQSRIERIENLELRNSAPRP